MAKAKKRISVTTRRVASAKKAERAKKITRRRSTPKQLELLPEPESDTLFTATLLPGYLISLKTKVKGGVRIDKDVIEPERITRSGASVSKVLIERTIENAEEFTEASQIRMKARMLVVNECAKSEFGLFCPDKNAQRLTLAQKEAQKIIKEFNARATIYRVGLYAVKGRVARDNVEATRAIKMEVRGLLDDMAKGIKDLDAELIRKAAGAAKNVISMLDPIAAGPLKAGIDASRKAARTITKAGEGAAQIIDKEAIKVLAEARTMFIEIEEEDVALEAADLERREAEVAEEEAAPIPRYRPQRREVEEV